MIKPTKALRKLIDLYPSRKLFAERCNILESRLSLVLDDDPAKCVEVSKDMMEALYAYTGWGFDDLFEVKPDGEKP